MWKQKRQRVHLLAKWHRVHHKGWGVCRKALWNGSLFRHIPTPSEQWFQHGEGVQVYEAVQRSVAGLPMASVQKSQGWHTRQVKGGLLDVGTRFFLQARGSSWGIFPEEVTVVRLVLWKDPFDRAIKRFWTGIRLRPGKPREWSREKMNTQFGHPRGKWWGKKKVCVKIPDLNSEWIVILLIENTGFHKQFWCWKIMGSIFIELSWRYLWGIQVQMSRVVLEVEVWTEDLGVVVNR